MENARSVEVLNDLVLINNDRIAGYERAINESKDLDVDLKATFRSMVKESEENKKELTDKIRQHGGTVESGTTTAGKIYRAWMDVKAKFTGNDRKAILASCEFGEDAAQRAYRSALDADMDGDCRQVVAQQQQSLQNSHDLIKRYRDAHGR
ncbi:MAG: PA2169 family four-helix-bundle protein [Flavipsychrobacter sp.]|nr:PA2169 family four-helix-bundle protein [Flavipsychrobacter sp.]